MGWLTGGRTASEGYCLILEQFGFRRLPLVGWAANPERPASFPQAGSGESLTNIERKLKASINLFIS
jgi:hypothetical protein